MHKYDLAILDVLVNTHDAKTKFRAVTRRDLLETLKISPTTVHRGLTRLLEEGYVDVGFQESREYTYYVTESGISLLAEVSK